MKQEQQRIAIAEACGWTQVRQEVGNYRNPSGQPGFISLPDYINDLNAMHEAEKVLTEDQKITYRNQLSGYTPLGAWDAISATASQRAEAFIRTLNLY